MKKIFVAYFIFQGLFCFSQTKSGKAENPVQSVKIIFHSYIKYRESTDTEENKQRMKESFLELEKKNKSEYFAILIDAWMYYDPTDFPTRKLIEPIFLKNKHAALEAVNKRVKNKKKWESTDSAPFSELPQLMEKLKQ